MMTRLRRLRKNRIRWCTIEVVRSSRVRKHNIVLKAPILKGEARVLAQTADPLSIWNLLFSEEILLQVFLLKDVDMIELKDFL
jgi:hypothetical protein